MDFKIRPGGSLSGCPILPGDKSISHRSVLLGALAQGVTRVSGLLLGEDVQMTIDAFRACGTKIEVKGDDCIIEGKGLTKLNSPAASIYCGNSGTAMRLMMGVFAGQNFPVTLTGDESLSSRPMRRVMEPLKRMGASIQVSKNGTAPVSIEPVKQLNSLNWEMQVPSAQVKSAILLAGLYASGRTTILESKTTRDHTEIMLNQFGIPVTNRNGEISVSGGKPLIGQHIQIPADISSAAFFIVAALLVPNSRINLANVGINPTRSALLEVLDSMGANISVCNVRTMGGEPVADIRIQYTEKLKAVTVNSSLIPRMVDEIPILAIAAASAEGITELSGCEELRFKESDRIRTVVQGLTSLGIVVQEKPDGMIIEGGQFKGGAVDSFGDHRIAMAFSIAGAIGKATTTVKNCDCVNTSFPGFSELSSSIGVNIEVAN